MQLTSPAFAAGSRLPKIHSLEGANRSPPLRWRDVPPTAQSLVILCEDPDAPRGTWWHWAVYDLDPATTGLPEGYPRTGAKPPARQAVNDFRRPGYDGPAPPPGHGLHHYHFRLLALSVPRLPVPPDARCQAVAKTANAYLLAQAVLTGTYER